MKIDGLFDEHNSRAVDSVTTSLRFDTPLTQRVAATGRLHASLPKTKQGLKMRTSPPDLIVFSHLRWDFVYQRPQHLLSRAARDRRVFFIEEPIFDCGPMHLDVAERECGVQLVVPHLPEGLESEVAREAVMQEMLNNLLRDHGISEYVLWYYTPMAMGFSRHLRPIATVYDCMDELSAFHGAPEQLTNREQQLFARADLVFTGGQSLYEAKRSQHKAVHAFPSSIDRKHFGRARTLQLEPADQQAIPHPRLGFFGVIDERFDCELLEAVARVRPEWQFVLVGPVVKIDPVKLPQGKNIHYLGAKKYLDLPDYLAGWDIALLPFARNDATRFISPTKTPEYLAAGKPVISTSIRDVVRPYGEQKFVRIADDPADFIRAVEDILSQNTSERLQWLERVDQFLSRTSWDETWARMSAVLAEAVLTRQASVAASVKPAMKSQAAGLVGA